MAVRSPPPLAMALLVAATACTGVELDVLSRVPVTDADGAPPLDGRADESIDEGSDTPLDSFVDATVDGAPDTAIDTAFDVTFPDFGPAPDAGCPPPTTPGPGAGTSCADPIPINLDITCKQTFTGDTCGGVTLSTSCGAGLAVVHALSISSGIRLYTIGVSGGHTLATIPGPPFCGGAGSCVGLGMATGVSKGTTQWWTVLPTGACGPYVLTITPT
jgi:hypothetical protein